MIVRTFNGLQSFASPRTGPTWGGDGGRSVSLYGQTMAYGEIYRRQPNVRTCVDFLSRNVAQLGLHVYRRNADNDRERLVDHQLARWLAKPNPFTSRYRLQESLVADLALYFNAYLAKMRYFDEARKQPSIALIRIPPEQMAVHGGILPSFFRWSTPWGEQRDTALTEVVYFNGYNPLNPLMGLSPLETLRRILAEEAASAEHREGFWRNGARIEGYVTRPATKPRYNPIQVADWRKQWLEQNAGGLAAGRTLLLQDGETYTPSGWSPKDSEYLSARKLSREECAAAYHIPLPLVGILEHATFSNIKEQHKHLYADCLGPWLELIQEEYERQLLTECLDQVDVYTEFNIAAKLAGSFEEQAASLQMAVGKPWMKVNEARGIQNLPRDENPDSDEIAAQQGGPSTSTGFPGRPSPRTEPDPQAITDVVQFARARQFARLDKVAARDRPQAYATDGARWNRELATDLFSLVHDPTEAWRMAVAANAETFTRLQIEVAP